MSRALLLVLVAGCAPRYFVSQVHESGDGLVVTRCSFGIDGKPTDDCYDEVDNSPAAYNGTPDPAEVRAVKRELDAPVEKRAAPTDITIAKALGSKGVRESLELCRSAYAPAVTSIDVSMTVAPSGEITQLATNAAGQFAQCSDRALRTASILSYDGAPVHSEQRLSL